MTRRMFAVAFLLTFASLALVSTEAFIPKTHSITTHRPTLHKLAYASSLAPEVHESTIDFLQSSIELMKKRNDLKQRLLSAADEFKAMQANLEKDVDVDDAGKEKQDDTNNNDAYVFRLLRRVVAKISGRKKATNGEDDSTHTATTTSKNILSRDKFRTTKLDTGESGNAVIALADELIKLNPTPRPTYGFKGYAGGLPSDCKLEGQWKLRFTTAADATFSESPKRGKTSTSQEIDCSAGTLTNVVDFERGKLDGFRVVVAGDPVSDDEIDLTFRKVEILRKSRLPKLLGRLTFRLPSKLIRRLSSDENKRGPYLQLLYLDDDLRIHKSGTGNLFIQSKIPSE